MQIMTLHKAKGLQFDTVIIPALDQTTGRKDTLLFHWMERPQPDGSEHVVLGPVKWQEDGTPPPVGTKLRVIPNHVCLAMNLADDVAVVSQGKLVDRWAVAARGKNK